MAHQNQMSLNGKDVNNPTAVLTINLADDNAEVRGFGQPVTRPMAREMAEDYFKQCENAFKIVDEIKTDPAYKKLKVKPEFNDLETLLAPESQTVSGVFGKEIILQILAQKNCEGIRYIIGKDSGKNTVILVGVKEDGEIMKDTSVAKSVPLENITVGSVTYKSLDAEVHGSSLTIAEARKILGAKYLKEDISNVLFGPY